ncbi:MAG: M23 family metallopeptidase [Clostridia bacterium]|nr:M23 family metallopeptidase [Clostridia bacterium]
MNFEKKENAKFFIFLLQISAVTVLIVALTVIKFLNPNLFLQLKNLYVYNFEGTTSVTEVTEPESQLNITNNQLKIIPVSVSANTAAHSYNNSLITPLINYTLTSGYGYRKNPFGSNLEFHKGVDLATNKGDIIISAASGKVITSQFSNSYGNYMVIEHYGGLKTLYAHCDVLLKNVGDVVTQGEIIAKVGSTGLSTGPHLHFEIILNNENINPTYLLSK